MSSVLWPERARLVARWLDSEVLPSPPTALVTSTTRSDAARAACNSMIRVVFDRLAQLVLPVILPRAARLGECPARRSWDSRHGADDFDPQAKGHIVRANRSSGRGTPRTRSVNDRAKGPTAGHPGET